MSLKFLNDVTAEINTLLADNAAGDITALDVRTVLQDITDSCGPPDCAWLSSAALPVQAVPATPAVIPAGAVVESNPDASIIFATAVSRQVTVLVSAARFLLSFNFELTLDGVPNNIVVSTEVFVNGIVTRWSGEITGRGAGRPLSINLAGRLVVNANSIIDVRWSSPGGTTAEVLTASLVVQVLPTKQAL